ncbi:MAG: hypothetical protein ACNA7Q_15770, partial [Rhodobacterales bacterium]
MIFLAHAKGVFREIDYRITSGIKSQKLHCAANTAHNALWNLRNAQPDVLTNAAATLRCGFLIAL